MKVAIQTHVTLELHGADHAPGVIEGGVLSQGAIELNIEALPGDIPDSLHFDVSGMHINETVTLSQLTAPAGVTLLDDPDETVLATLTPPTLEPVEDEIETETELVGEGEAARPPRRSRGRRRRGGRAAGLRRVLKLFSSAPVDWLVVGLGNPGSRYDGTPHNVGFQVADALIARWDLPKPKKKFAGELSEGRTGPGGPRVAVLKPQTYMNEAGRSVGPARGSFKLDARPRARDPRRDRPAVRRHPRAARRRARRPQRAQVAQARAGQRGLPPRADRRRPARHDRPRHRRRLRAREWRQSAAEVRDLVERARDEAERLVLASEG